MSSEIFEINSTAWTQVTTTEKSGSYLAIGSESIFIYQGATAPVGVAGVAPIMDAVYSAYPHPFCDLGSEFLFARTVSGISNLHVTGGA